MNQESKWGAKEAAKAGQKFRREARNIFAEYEHDLKKKLEEVRIIVKKRPRWLARLERATGWNIWLWFASFFVDLNASDKALIFETPGDFLARKHHEAVAKRSPVMVTKPTTTGKESGEIADLIEPTTSSTMPKQLEYQVAAPTGEAAG